MFNNKSVLITGGTGSFGKKMTEIILRHYKPRKLIIFSRDELKQYEMAKLFSKKEIPCMRYLLGDVRDKERLYRAFQGVDFVIHAAALKHIPSGEYNPFEVIKTNIIGGQNVIECAIDQGITKLIGLSTDKAANPVNLYGATKLCSDKLFMAGWSYAGPSRCKISIVRYGNVIASSGSVIPLFIEQQQRGLITITDPRMTRFWITLEEACYFVAHAFSRMEGREIFIPKLPSMAVADIARVIAPNCETKNIGLRPGEKLHEKMIVCDDSRYVAEYDDYYIQLSLQVDRASYISRNGGKAVCDGFEYSSNTNRWWLTDDELRALIAEIAGNRKGMDPRLPVRWNNP